MGTEDVQRIRRLIKTAQTSGRSKHKITKTLRDEGKIEKKGNLRHNYKKISNLTLK